MRTRPWIRLAVAVFAAAAIVLPAQEGYGEQRPFKILHVMSYHSPWRWTDGQLAGFKDGMAGAAAEYRVFRMDTKTNSSTAAKEAKGSEARALIEQWKPDLVYTSDDDAQEFVAIHYRGAALPIVFSGVNKDPAAYGFDQSPNITGVLEEEHFVETLRLLRAIDPQARRIAAVFDDAPLWEQVRRRMKERIGQVPGMEIVAWDTPRTFEEYQKRIKTYPEIADAIGLIGIFSFKGADGRNVPYQDVLRWTAENSTLPDFSFWIDRIHYGTLLAVTVSEREQGYAAGRIARAILLEGKAPAQFKMVPTVKGLPVISLARAERLGLRIKSGVLLSAEVVRRFEWEK